MLLRQYACYCEMLTREFVCIMLFLFVRLLNCCVRFFCFQLVFFSSVIAVEYHIILFFY